MFCTNRFLVPVVLLFGLTAARVATAQTFWSETFSEEGAANAAWSNGGTNPGPADWTWTNDPSAGYQDPDLPAFAAPTATDGYFYFNSESNGLVPHDVTLTGLGKPADCTGKFDVRLRFFSQYIYFNPTGTIAEVGVSTDGVHFNYHPLFAGLPANLPYHDWVELDLDEADNQPQVWLQFRWIGNYEYHWKVDDLRLFVSCKGNPAAIICDDFEAYDPTQKLGPQAAWWTTWSGTEGGAEDGIVSTEVANSAPKSLKIVSTDPNGGPQDVVLDLGNRSAGRYELKWNMYIPAGKEAYYNIQNAVPVGTGDWNLHLYFNAGQTGQVRQTSTGPVLGEFNFPADKWFEVQQVLDLDNDLISLYVDGHFVLKRGYLRNLGGIDFFGNNANSLFYVDDLSFVALPPQVFNPDFCETAVDISPYFGQQPGVAQTTGLFDNTNASVSATDPEVTCWDEVSNNGKDLLNTTLWYTFAGDGSVYEIQTVPCSATNYIGTAQGDKGDTQMLAYSGPNCTDLTPVQCNDDLFPNGQPDFRAGITLETQPGQSYFLLIDGFEKQGIVATGEFCIQITRKPEVDCAAGHSGTFALDNDGYLCAGEKLVDIISVNTGSFVLPTIGPQYGLCWCFSPEPLLPDQWPGQVAGIASTPFSTAVGQPALLNNGASLNYGKYYLTPVVLGGGTLINPSALPYIFNVDPAGGCYFVGESRLLTLLPPLDPLAVAVQTTPEMVPPGGNGTVTLLVSGGAGGYLNDAALYQYQWNNGKAGKDLSGLTAGTYTVTISDRSGCVSPLVGTATVTTQVLQATDPAIVRSFQLWPNPASEQVWLNIVLEQSAELRIDLFNLLGQAIETTHAGPVETLKLTLPLAHLAEGLYLVRLNAGGQTAWRTFLIQH